MQRLTGIELVSDLPFECNAVRSMLRHGFHSPETQPGVFAPELECAKAFIWLIAEPSDRDCHISLLIDS